MQGFSGVFDINYGGFKDVSRELCFRRVVKTFQGCRKGFQGHFKLITGMSSVFQLDYVGFRGISISLKGFKRFQDFSKGLRCSGLI